MQSIVEKKKSGLTPHQAWILSQLTLPYVTEPLRIRAAGCGGSAVKTAVTKNFENVNYNLQNVMAAPLINVPYYTRGPDTVRVWGPTDVSIPIIHFNDPYILGLMPYPNPNQTPWNYECDHLISSMAKRNGLYTRFVFSDPSVGNLNVPLDDGTGKLSLNPAFFLPQTSNTCYGAVHPTVEYPQTIQGRKAVWIDAGSNNPATIILQIHTDLNTVIQNGAVVAGVTDVYFEVAKMNSAESGSDLVKFVNVPAQGSSTLQNVTITIIDSGFYTFNLRGTATNLGISSVDTCLDLRLIYTGTTALVSRFVTNSNLPGTNALSRLLAIDAQVNGAGLLISNTTPQISRGGRVYATSASNGANWYDYSYDPENTIMSANPASTHSNDWSDGVYGFIKPINTSILRKVNKSSSENNLLYAYPCGYVVATQSSVSTGYSGMNVFVIQPPVATSTTTGVSATAVLNFCVSYEFTTNSQLFTKASTEVSPADFDRAMMILSEMDQFSTNAFHLSEMWNSIKKAAGGAARAVAPWSKVASAILSKIPHPVAQEIGSALNAINSSIIPGLSAL